MQVKENTKLIDVFYNELNRRQKLQQDQAGDILHYHLNKYFTLEITHLDKSLYGVINDRGIDWFRKNRDIILEEIMNKMPKEFLDKYLVPKMELEDESINDSQSLINWIIDNAIKDYEDKEKDRKLRMECLLLCKQWRSK